jgi:hypothetical protein
LVDRNSPITYVGLVITVVAVFVLPLPPVLSIGLAVFGFLLTMLEGRTIYRLFAGALLGWSVFVLLLTGAVRPAEVPDLREPIPVPSGYGFKLDPGSTNLEHTYRSEPVRPKQLEFSLVSVLDHYVNGLSRDWTVVRREERPDLSYAQLKQNGSSRGISITVIASTPLGQPAVLDLTIQALVCGDETGCMTAPIHDLVRYPGGEPVVPRPHPSPGPLHEPVPLPPEYGFVLDTGVASSEEVHAYQSTTRMSIREARAGQRSVMRYYHRALKDWTVVASAQWYLLIKEPDSTDGLAIETHLGPSFVQLEIRSISCQGVDWCSYRPVGA